MVRGLRIEQKQQRPRQTVNHDLGGARPNRRTIESHITFAIITADVA